MRNLGLYILTAALMAAPHASAAVFTAKAEEGKVTVYVTSTKPEKCGAVAKFTYLENNKREEGWTSCGYFITKPGKDVEVCYFEDPKIVAPLITGFYLEGCTDAKTGEKAEARSK